MKSYQQLFAELKRRHVFKVAAIYGATSFVVLQLADILLPALGLPEWTITFMVAILVLAFPVALIIAWAFEMTPDGVKRTDAPEPGEIEAIVSAPLSQRWPAGLLAVLGVAALLGSGWWIGRRTAPASGIESTGATAADVNLAMTAAAEDSRPAIAVLPFADMSAGGDQEYFCDGMSEEILNTLAKIRELRVAGRTSAFAYKGQNEDLRRIGSELGVDHLLEGSVRKEGDRLRITAQLVDAGDGSHLWSETYDRTMDDVFAIQTEIAQAIAAELRVPLGLDAGDLVNPTADLEAYDLYLAGRARMRERYGSLKEAVRLFEAAIARDSTWAPAWAGLAEALELTGWYQTVWDDPPDDVQAMNVISDGFWARSEQAARRALELDPDNASAHVALGSVLRNRHEWGAAEAAYRKALAGDPDNPEAFQQYADMLLQMGRIREGLAAAERAVLADPAPIRIYWHSQALEDDDRIREAKKVIGAGLVQFPAYGDLRDGTVRLYAMYGGDVSEVPVSRALADSLATFVREFREGAFGESRDSGLDRPLAWMAAGMPDSALARFSAFATDNDASPALMWIPAFDGLRQKPEYLETLRLLNLEGAVPQRTPR